MSARELTPIGLLPVFERAWSKETSASPDRWTSLNPSLGQCAVTSLVLNTMYSGDILNSVATLPDGTTDSHYMNLINGELVDLTKQQFPEGTEFTDPVPKTKEFDSTRDYILSYDITARRYRILDSNFRYYFLKSLHGGL